MDKVFIVEDDNNIRELIVYALNSSEFQAEGFENAKSLYQRLEEETPNLFILDIMLDGDDGYTILQNLRENSQTKATPVIMLTAKTAEYDKVKGLDMGADDYITKPFRIRELLSRIASVLRRYERQPVNNPHMKKIGHISVDTMRGKVYTHGTDIELTAMEYRLLLTFMSHPNQILTREQILEKLWDAAGEFVNDNTLTVYIKRLREKIEEDPQKPTFITTVRGVGYRIGDAYATKS